MVLEVLARYTVGGAVHGAVACALKPGFCLFLQLLYADEAAAAKEVVFDMLHGVFHTAL